MSGYDNGLEPLIDVQILEDDSFFLRFSSESYHRLFLCQWAAALAAVISRRALFRRPRHDWISLSIFIGVATPLRYVFGTELNRLRMASLAGFIGMLIFVAAPFVRMFLVHAGAHESPTRSGWDTYGLSVMFSVVATGPMVVLMLLALSAWTSKLRGTVYS